MKSFVIFLKAARSADFSHPSESFKLHSYLNKHFRALCSRESPFPGGDPQITDTALSLPRPPLNLLLGEACLIVVQLQSLTEVNQMKRLIFTSYFYIFRCGFCLERPNSSIYDHACSTWHQSNFSVYLTVFYSEVLHLFFFSHNPCFVKEKVLLQKRAEKYISTYICYVLYTFIMYDVYIRIYI